MFSATATIPLDKGKHWNMYATSEKWRSYTTSERAIGCISPLLHYYIAAGCQSPQLEEWPARKMCRTSPAIQIASMPAERCSGRSGGFVCVFNLLAEESLEVLG